MPEFSKRTRTLMWDFYHTWNELYDSLYNDFVDERKTGFDVAAMSKASRVIGETPGFFFSLPEADNES